MGENEQTIDELNIKINAEAKKGSSGIDKLTASIQKLRDVTGGGAGNLTGIAASFIKLNSAISDLKGKSGSITSIVNSFEKLNKLNVDIVSNKITILSKSIGVLGNMDSSLKTIISDLAALARSGNGSVAENALKLQANAAKAQATIDKSALTSAKAQEGLKAIADRNREIEETAQRAAKHESDLREAYNNAKNVPVGNISHETEHTPFSESFLVSINESQAEADAFIEAAHSKVMSEIKNNKPKVEIDTDIATAELRKVGEYIDSLSPAISSMSNEAKERFYSIADSLSFVSRQIDNQRNSYRLLQNTAMKVEQEKGNGSSAYLKLEKQMLSADASIDRLIVKQKELKAALGEMGDAAATASSKITSGSSRASVFVDRLKQSFSDMKGKIEQAGTRSNSFFSMGRFYGWYFILQQAATTFGGFINNINSFIENQNLFSVAMGKSAQSGRQLADSLQSVLGIDSGEAMRYMGVFQQMETSFGITNKQASIMSENFTQLGYDIASFYNISTSDAFTKLQSGLAGQTRSLRTLGIDISSARLQQELYNQGINEKVKDLNEADKAELIYIAVMKQTKNAQGDMARTILTPANALRILQAQLTITGRAIGSIFVPALLEILPPVTAVIELIGDLASELASFLGFKMPKIDYSSLNTGLPGIADDAEKAADSVGDIGKNAEESKKQMNDLIGGFDELNILQNNKDSAAEASKKANAGDIGSILSGINLPSYDALSGAIGNNITSLKNKIKDFLQAFREDPLTTFANALWGVDGAFGDLSGWLSKMDFVGVLTGISAAVMAFGITKNPILALAIGAVTAALTELFPEKARIDLLNGSLATLGVALVLKTFTGMPFKLALGVSALATSGLIELVGKDDAINLLASSLTGLGAGIMAFTFSGNLPLALAIGATTTALSGMAIHFSEFRIAPALLTGVSSALLAFKFGGFSQGSAGLIGFGVAIASFSELNDISPALRTALLGLAGAITGVGTAIRLGFGVEGVIITAVAGAIIALGAGLIQAGEDAKKADLEKRFGSIALSAQEVEDIAKRLTTTPWTVKIDAAITAEEKVKEFENNLKTDIETLDKMNWEVSVGIKLSKDEIGTYKQTISSFISDAENYVKQQQYSVTLAIDAILEPGSATAKNLTAFTTKYYSDTQVELDKLGTQLSNEVNKAFEDNVLSEGEIIKIQEIQKKMNDLLQKIADQKYKATLKSLELDTKDTGITADSFKDLQKKIGDNIKDQITQAESSRQQLIIMADTQFKIDKKAGKTDAQKVYDKAIQDIQDAFNAKKATLDLPGLSVSLDTLKSKFSTELGTTKPMLESGVKEMFSSGLMKGYTGGMNDFYKGNAGWMAQKLTGYYQNELKNANISGPAKDEIKELVEQLQPTEDDLKQISSSCLKAGKAVPENVANGISDIEEMKAVGGNTDAISYLVGKTLSTDPDFLSALSTAKDAGKSIDASTAQGLADNVQLVKDSSTGTITGIKDSVTGKITEISPTLKQNLSDLGIDMSNSLVKSVNDNIPKVNDAAGNMSKGALKGAQDQMKQDKSNWYDWAIWPWNWFRQANDIHSPSKVFEGGGKNIVLGLWNGITSKWDSLKRWWQDNVHFPDIKLPHFSLSYDYSGWMADALQWLGMPGIPKINVKWYASGGVFNSPSVVGVGEAGPEAVVPLSEDSPWIDRLADSLKEKQPDSGDSKNDATMYQMMRMAFVSALKETGGDITVPVSVNMDGTQVAYQVVKIEKKDQRRFTTQPT